ncbi:MAG: glycosyltransferase family 4 protein [Bacteroidota bacterium]
MRILLTCFSRSWGGLEIQAVELARQLQARGHETWLACIPDSRLEKEAADHEIRTLPFDVTGYVHPRLVWRLAKFISRTHLDVIHCQLSKDIATVVPAVKAGMSDVPVLLTRSMGSYVNKKDPLHQFTYGNVSLVLAVSSVIRQNVIDTTPMSAEQVIVVPYGIDTSLFSSARTDRTVTRKSLGYADSDILVGFVGRFSPGKGHEEFLRAADIARKEDPRLRYLIVGEPSFGEEEYARRVHELHVSLGLQSVVTFAGFRRDVRDLMAAFDIFAFPSHAESFGIVLIEAMAMERPVVASNCDGVLDIVVDQQTGILVPPKDDAPLARAILRLAQDPALRVRMGSAGRQRVLEQFDQQAIIDRIVEIYRSVQESDSE